MSAPVICLFVLLGAVFSQSNAFSFSIKAVGTKQAYVTPGDVITYNAHITVSKTTPLSFHVSLPYFNTPIFSIEKFEILGVGSNLNAWKPSVQYSKVDANYPLTRSQLSLAFSGTVNRSSSPNGAAFADKIVIQVQSRVLKHNNVTTDAVFWLYYGMEYLSESVWVIGKSVKVDVKPASARLAAKVSLPFIHIPTTDSGLTVIVEIYHLPDSKSSATGVTLELSIPSYLAYSSAQEATVPGSSFSSSGTTLTGTLSQPLEVGVPFRVTVGMSISVAVKGKFINGHIYGNLKYDTKDEEDCPKSVEHKQIVQMSFKAYAHKDTCDSALTLTAAMVNASSQAQANTGPEKVLESPGSATQYGWRPWNIYAGSTHHLVDNFLQVNFGKKATLTRMAIVGTTYQEQFVKSFLVSYSQDSAFWKYFLHFGKPKEFEANTDSVNIVINLFQPEIQARYLRIHVKKYYANGPSMHMFLYGCTDQDDVPSYTVYQRAYLAAENMLILCNVYPDRTKGKTNCYSSANDGLLWNAMDPRVVNVLGYDPTSSKIYALGVTTSDTPTYMVLDPLLGLRFIAEADWISVSGTGITFPTVIPLVPVNGNPLYKISGTAVTVGSVYYVASPESLLKGDGVTYAAIASWADYKVY